MTWQPFGSTMTCPKCNGTEIERSYNATEDRLTGKRTNECLRATCLDCGWYTREHCADAKMDSSKGDEDGHDN